MISVGIDVSKEKSTVCILKPYGEIISSPFEVTHTESSLNELTGILMKLNDEIRVVMEATGVYHLPLLNYLQEKGIFVSIINPLVMKKYRSMELRRVKTDRQDSIKIAKYGLDQWYHLKEYEAAEEKYKELRMLGRQYIHYMELRLSCVQALFYWSEQTMPGITKLLELKNSRSQRSKLADFIQEYWHYDNITVKSEKEFIESYQEWAHKNGYHGTEKKARAIFQVATDGIPTFSSSTPSTKMLILEAVQALNEMNRIVHMILSHMQEIASKLPEYSVVKSMAGVGDNLAPRLIAEIGDVRRFYSAKALVAYAGLDAPPFQSGQFTGTNRKISKRGSSQLRKIGYETMKCLKIIKPETDQVYKFIIKKESEGKAKKVAKIAGLNKFLRIYYARVKEVYQ